MRTLITGFATGFAAAQAFLVGLVALDLGGFGSLLAAASEPWLPLGLLSVALGGLVGAAASVTAFVLPPPPPSQPAITRSAALRRTS